MTNQTLNIQRGSHNTINNYNAPVQVNHYQERTKTYCEVCDRELIHGDANSAYFFAGSGVHVSCWWEQRRQVEAREMRQIEARSYPIIEHQPLMALPEPKQPQYREVWVRDDPAKYAHMPRPVYIPLVKTLVLVDEE